MTLNAATPANGIILNLPDPGLPAAQPQVPIQLGNWQLLLVSLASIPTLSASQSGYRILVNMATPFTLNLPLASTVPGVNYLFLPHTSTAANVILLGTDSSHAACSYSLLWVNKLPCRGFGRPWQPRHKFPASRP